MTQLTATFTVTIKTKPDGDYYFDHDDLVRNVVPWIEGGLDDRDDIAEVTITALPAASAVVEPPADRDALRQRIAEVLWPLTNWDGDQLNAERAADAVLAVLPEPADRATGACVCRGNPSFTAEIGYPVRCPHCPPGTGGILPTHLTKHVQHHHPEVGPAVPPPVDQAAEAQERDVAWHILTHQRGTWRPWLAPRHNHADAREDYDRCVSADGHRWAFRLVRETSTFTVEAEHKPAAGAQDGAAQ